jgi:hypothetical protein
VAKRALTEAAWLVCHHPTRMIRHLGHDPRNRKQVLLAAACLRRVWDWLPDPRSRNAVEVAERFADGQATEDELRAAREAARQFGSDSNSLLPREPHWKVYALPAEAAGRDDHIVDVLMDVASATAWSKADTPEAITAPEERAQAQLARDVFGNPFRPVALDHAWPTPTVIALAQAAYNERLLPSGHLAPTRLAILADALEEAGCAHLAILDHLRGPGPHVRGCWAVDLVLGKE